MENDQVFSKPADLLVASYSATADGKVRKVSLTPSPSSSAASLPEMPSSSKEGQPPFRNFENEAKASPSTDRLSFDTEKGDLWDGSGLETTPAEAETVQSSEQSHAASNELAAEVTQEVSTSNVLEGDNKRNTPPSDPLVNEKPELSSDDIDALGNLSDAHSFQTDEFSLDPLRTDTTNDDTVNEISASGERTSSDVAVRDGEGFRTGLDLSAQLHSTREEHVRNDPTSTTEKGRKSNEIATCDDDFSPKVDTVMPTAASTKEKSIFIDLLDEKEETPAPADSERVTAYPKPPTIAALPSAPNPNLQNQRKRPRLTPDPLGASSQGSTIRPGCSIPQSTALQPGTLGRPAPPLPSAARVPSRLPSPASVTFDKPYPYPYPPGFVPTWRQLLPVHVKPPPTQQRRVFLLSLLNVSEFTITGLPASFNGQPTPVSGLRPSIKSIARDHGKAVFDRDAEGGGKWRIPLGAYHAFAAFLDRDPLTTVHGIPQQQLQVAFLERQRQGRGYPSSEKLIEMGLPAGLAKALAPFQRGGVDFVISKGGRALLADDMGLGKTIQGVASMAIYHKEWPLLVLTPSSARYHWENEFQNWLGINSQVNKHEDGDDISETNTDMLLRDSQINVLGSSKDQILPSESTRVVICSYGLVSVLVESGKLRPGMFPCAIVDESHMLKNKSSKRTQCLLPVLMATNRCVLLSGTPALARPAELWPQLCIVGKDQRGLWDNEDDFLDRYVRRGDAQSRAELHALLTGTVMIRRLKVDILKTMPRKCREKADVSILSEEQRRQFKALLEELRQGKGALGKLARQEHEESRGKPEDSVDDIYHSNRASLNGDIADVQQKDNASSSHDIDGFQRAKAELQARTDRQFEQGRIYIEQNFLQIAHNNSEEERRKILFDLHGNLRSKVNASYNEGMLAINSRFGNRTPESKYGEYSDTENKTRNVLSRLYELSGNAKIPLIVDLLQRWLNDPTKGKLCIFAHHISVLDAIAENAGLSNSDDIPGKKYIRIDGSTTPKLRQQQIKAFQTDPSTRIALLGITAAGVAVTLTAASTVWFAELFWTPAIMIQAEDRCHRIGQTAQVKCVYFVARGTVDNVLWRLIEKKFRDLGEFVEGKEKLKLVIDKEYHRVKELHDLFQDDKFDDGDSDELLDGGIEEDDAFQLDVDLVHDIEVFGEEECMMLQNLDNNDHDGGTSDRASPITSGQVADSTTLSTETPCQQAGTGRSEEDAIALSDDEDEAPAPTNPNNAQLLSTSRPISSTTDLQRFTAYKIYLQGTLGLELGFYNGRIIVNRVLEPRRMMHGEDCKPAVGDILTSFNGFQVHLVRETTQVLSGVRAALARGTVEFVFSSDPSFTEYYIKHRAERRRRRMKEKRARIPTLAEPVNDVIEID